MCYMSISDGMRAWMLSEALNQMQRIAVVFGIEFSEEGLK